MLADLFNQLDAQHLELQALVLGAELVEARTFTLPIYDKEQTKVHETVSVIPSTGEDARSFGWQRIKSYVGDPNTNLKMTRKAAGFIWLDCHPETLVDLCDQVNETKLAIKAFLAAQRNRHVRFDMVHELCTSSDLI
ncbi:DNA replication terminus site-binding protein [Motilimonas cestriensis]|uniref:DNA replication terminus site-binding protein n=1 Tax=Motilimonas cestriensis TaxID=2742685 RepID=A0ABS8WFA9_9GAMM|nr:DNA replication terminus site-binding protein [Motilimonas cestriensis]MCE2597253.1 DNA replication terminus site-binding protein [Motilimonas cestriensis]